MPPSDKAPANAVTLLIETEIRNTLEHYHGADSVMSQAFDFALFLMRTFPGFEIPSWAARIGYYLAFLRGDSRYAWLFAMEPDFYAGERPLKDAELKAGTVGDIWDALEVAAAEQVLEWKASKHRGRPLVHSCVRWHKKFLTYPQLTTAVAAHKGEHGMAVAASAGPEPVQARPPVAKNRSTAEEVSDALRRILKIIGQAEPCLAGWRMATTSDILQKQWEDLELETTLVGLDAAQFRRLCTMMPEPENFEATGTRWISILPYLDYLEQLFEPQIRTVRNGDSTTFAMDKGQAKDCCFIYKDPGTDHYPFKLARYYYTPPQKGTPQEASTKWIAAVQEQLKDLKETCLSLLPAETPGSHETMPPPRLAEEKKTELPTSKAGSEPAPDPGKLLPNARAILEALEGTWSAKGWRSFSRLARQEGAPIEWPKGKGGRPRAFENQLKAWKAGLAARASANAEQKNIKPDVVDYGRTGKQGYTGDSRQATMGVKVPRKGKRRQKLTEDNQS